MSNGQYIIHKVRQVSWEVGKGKLDEYLRAQVSESTCRKHSVSFDKLRMCSTCNFSVVWPLFFYQRDTCKLNTCSLNLGGCFWSSLAQTSFSYDVNNISMSCSWMCVNGAAPSWQGDERSLEKGQFCMAWTPLYTLPFVPALCSDKDMFMKCNKTK